jgi:tRNA-Thr(GGU) m(6)t(6)A37 methyltransferase TsaA
MMGRPQDIDAPPPPDAERPVIDDPDALPDCGPWRPIGVIHSQYRNHFGTPRQPGTTEAAADGWIILRRGLQNGAGNLRGFERIWIIFHFCYSRGGARTVVKPPRDPQPRGVFATRAPHRPVPIGLSCVRLLNVRGRKLLIRDHDLLHGTPVLDIKPYIPAYDAHPDSAAGWVDGVAGGEDHRWW